MEFHNLLMQLMLVSTTIGKLGALDIPSQVAKPGCQEKCGNVSIPYPFGMTEGCYLNEAYLIICRKSGQPYLLNNHTRVLDISLEGHLRVMATVGYKCYDKQGNQTLYKHMAAALSNFTVSSTQNKFTAVGCDTLAMINGYKTYRYTTGCLSLCNREKDVINGSCSGIGCCQTSIPKGVRSFSLSITSFNGHKDVHKFSECSYAFVVEETQFNFSITNLDDLRNINGFPAIFDWSIWGKTCAEAQKNKTTYTCRENSDCYDTDDGSGYRCNCSQGYSGNPYLPNGCQDINECEYPHPNNCSHNCINIVGSYQCFCPKGHHGDGKKGGQSCILDENLTFRTITIVGISIGIVIAFAINVLVLWGVLKRHVMKQREIFFRQNGGILLQKLLSENKDHAQVAKIFTEESLKKATNNFHENNVVGQGGYGTVYRGTLPNNITVAIKKSKVIDKHQITQFVNEVIILSQIKHPNVVKLLGCCLESPVPCLVYEFITNNTLFHHLHNQGESSQIPWKLRLKIATETADALAHMQSTTQIIHRDVKSANILLNDEYTAKVSDFGISRFIPLEKTHLSTLVKGTIGYIDPEYFRSGNLTEKSDVYSFGVVLVELLTGKTVVSSDISEFDIGLAMYFISYLEKANLFQVLEDRVKKEGPAKQLQGVAELARKCLELKGELRPTMKEVKKELETIGKFEEHLSPT